jgi:hypothetical protein
MVTKSSNRFANRGDLLPLYLSLSRSFQNGCWARPGQWNNELKDTTNTTHLTGWQPTGGTSPEGLTPSPTTSIPQRSDEEMAAANETAKFHCNTLIFIRI